MCVCVKVVEGSPGSYIFDVSIFQMGFCAQGKCLLVSILENLHVYIWKKTVIAGEGKCRC